MSTLGVIVFSIPGMRHLSQCLKSIEWADRVRVVHLDREDSFICGGGACPPSEAVDTDWVLHLWAEEQVMPDLREELLMIRGAEVGAAPSLYLVPIRSHLLGRCIEGSLWGPTPAPRLMRHVENFPLGWWSPPGGKDQEGAGSLKGWIEDYSCDELSDGVDRVNGLSSLWARRMQSEGRALTPGGAAIYSLRILWSLLFHGKLATRGLAGLSLSSLAAYTVLASGMKLWELHHKEV